MSIVFYCVSGSPYAWKVWLALEHKGLDYELRLLSMDAGDPKKPAFLGINPRGRVPALVDDDLVLYESSAIVEYLEDAYPGASLWPRTARARALARRVTAEADVYLGPAARRLLWSTLFRRADDGDPSEIAAATQALAPEIAWAERICANGLIAGEPSAADHGIYPWLAMLRRLDERQPRHGVHVSAPLRAYMAAVERLPYLPRTIPPHWRNDEWRCASARS